MKVKVHNVSEGTEINLNVINNIYKLSCKVFDAASYLSNKKDGDGSIPRFQSEGEHSNSALIREATEGIVVALLRKKYSV